MPIKMNYVGPFYKRFDFGVPLEDIFPPNDIHPRLKYLFEEAYKFNLGSSLQIERVVNQLQGSLETRLELKERMIKDVHYDIKTEKIEEAPGAYFWIIRHFLGLLPVPLLPMYSRDNHFDWVDMSEKCKNFLQHYESQRLKKHQLDFNIAENLNLLPFEHFLLLTILVQFVRKLSRKPGYEQQINRRCLLFLTNYYCASTCTRPYTPGHKNEKMFPLFFYIVLRWREIEKKCKSIGHPAYFLESNFLNYETSTGFGIRDNWAQTPRVSTEIIKIYKNVPYFCNNNNYLKDAGCQTEQTSLLDMGTQSSDVTYEEQKKHEQLSDQEISSTPDTLFVPIDSNAFDNGKFGFLSTDDKVEWCDVIKEAIVTVKKPEEYIYDDYDTFNKEDYNQISDGNQSKSSQVHKCSKIGWTYTPENSPKEKNDEITFNSHKARTTNSKFENGSKIGWTYTPEISAAKKSKERSFDDSNEADNTYVRFEDVFDENGEFRINEQCDNNYEMIGNCLNIDFKKCNDSKTPLCNEYSLNSTNKLDQGEEKRKNFNMKRFKLKLDFLRIFTPNKVTHSTPSHDNSESKVKYRKIKSIKSNTL